MVDTWKGDSLEIIAICKSLSKDIIYDAVAIKLKEEYSSFKMCSRSKVGFL